MTGGQAWIAYEYGGEPLDAEHGGPARLLVPHTCTSERAPNGSADSSSSSKTGATLKRGDNPIARHGVTLARGRLLEVVSVALIALLLPRVTVVVVASGLPEPRQLSALRRARITTRLLPDPQTPAARVSQADGGRSACPQATAREPGLPED